MTSGALTTLMSADPVPCQMEIADDTGPCHLVARHSCRWPWIYRPRMLVSVFPYMSPYAHVLHIHMHVYIYIYVFLHVHVPWLRHICMRISTLRDTHTHAYIYTWILLILNPFCCYKFYYWHCCCYCHLVLHVHSYSCPCSSY